MVIGDSAREATFRSAWPATGTYGPIPRRRVIGLLGDVLDSIGPELWEAKRKGTEACLIRLLETYDLCTALLWAADCVEHLARRVGGVDGNVVETLELARGYAREQEFQPEAAHRLALEAEEILVRLRKWCPPAKTLISRAAELELDVGPLGPERDALRSRPVRDGRSPRDAGGADACHEGAV